MITSLFLERIISRNVGVMLAFFFRVCFTNLVLFFQYGRWRQTIFAP